MSTELNRLAALTELASGDQVAIYDASGGLTGRAAISLLNTFLESLETGEVAEFTSQYLAPLTGATVQVTDSTANTRLILTPAGTIATLTIKMPTTANSADHQRCLVTSTQAVTTLTMDGNGSSVVGAPTALTANQFFELMFDDVLDTWYRVG